MTPHEYLRTFKTADAIPELDVALPRKLVALHQIEITSRCSLRCPYCPSPTLQRPKLDMARAHYERALEHVHHYVGMGEQAELNLAGIGESTLHPEFVDYVRLAREAVGEFVHLTMATNGVGYDEDLVEAVAPYRLLVWVSMHRPEKAALARLWWEKRGMLAGVSTDPSTNSNDWAGQVKWPHTQRYATACMWLRRGMAMVMADGRITACCLDGGGYGVIGHVDDEVGSLQTQPYKLCRSCHQVVAIRGYEQRSEK